MKPVVLAILDGWGYSKQMVGNAISNASTPTLDEIKKSYPSLLLQASGLGVGMTWGEPGNSEVGHLTIGAGRTILQYLVRINRDIESGYFFQNKDLLNAINHAKNNNSTVHILGLLGSGSVHSYLNHVLALIELSKRNGFSNFQLHFFTDGKDSALQDTPNLINKIEEYSPGSMSHIASLIGRDYAMDRNNRWDLTQKAYQLWTEGIGEMGQDIFRTLESLYAKGHSDADMPAIIFNKNGIIRDNDSLIFFNFREDSMRQIIRTFIDEIFTYFNRKKIQNLRITTFTPYIEEVKIHAVYPAPYIANGLAEVISMNNKKQLHITETEKYAHVTYFFNCLKNKPFTGETDLFLPSVPDPLTSPEMATNDITFKVISELGRNHYDFIVINYANADILAHLGDLEKAIKGIECIDRNLIRLKEAVLAKNGTLIITSDHGNAERLTYKISGNPQTKHDRNPVPFYLVGDDYKDRLSSEKDISGLLADIAPTILNLMGLDLPQEMNGVNLLKKLEL